MSAISDFLLGTSGEPTSVVNTTPATLSGLSDPIAKLLREVLEKPTTGTYTGAYTSPMTAEETKLLGVLNNYATSDPQSLRSARDTLTSMTTGSDRQGPLLQENVLGRGQDLVSAILSGSTFNPQTDAILQNAISAALRPLERRFDDQMRSMRGNFTAAGQYVQPGASSPFEYAKSRLEGDLATAMGDTSSRIIADNLISERARQGDILNLQATAVDNAKQRQLDASQAIPTLEKVQLEGLVKALETNALPRLIEQLGLVGGREEFARQQELLTRVLELALRGAAPNAGVVPGTTGTPGFLNPIVNAAGTTLGNAAGSKVGDIITDVLFGGSGGENQTSGGGGGLFETGMGMLGDVWNGTTDIFGNIWDSVFNNDFASSGDGWLWGEGFGDMGSPSYLRTLTGDSKW